MKKEQKKPPESVIMRITTNSKNRKAVFSMEQIAIFCDIDDFCKDYEKYCTHSLLMDKNEVVPKTRMSLSEIMTILIMYNLSGYRTFNKAIDYCIKIC